MLSALHNALFGLSAIPSTIVSVAIMLFVGFLMTRIGKLLRLPNVSAYIIAGILVGPFVLNLIPDQVIDGMGFIQAQIVSLFSNNQIDYNDMIIKAKSLYKSKGNNKNIKYLIIDEFQDTSNMKFELIKEIQKKTNCNIFAVGDCCNFNGKVRNIFMGFADAMRCFYDICHRETGEKQDFYGH